MNDKSILDQSTIPDSAPKNNNNDNKEKNKEYIIDNSSEKKKKRKKKQKTKQMDKENSLPIAQSTLINSLIEDAQCNNRNKMLDISELPNATEDESSISSINIADLNAIPAAKIAQHEETTKTKEMPEEKVSNIRFGLIK